MAGPNDDRAGAPPSHIHIEKNKQPAWFKALAWLLLALGLLALLLGLSRCHREDRVATAPASAPGKVIATTPNAATSTALAGTSGLGAYLAGTEAAPRSFVFEKLNFDTAKSVLRPEDAVEVNEVAATLAKYPTAHVRIAGYADARGSDAANVALGKARADSVKAALVGKGVDGSRIDTVSGGESDPVDTNATPAGRFENRRTELVVTAR